MSSWEAGKGRTLIEEMKLLGEFKGQPGSRKAINSELWHACAGPLISLPQPGDLVYYFPQGHSEQVTASTRRHVDSQVPNYPCLPYQMLCQVHGVTLHADKETDEIYAQMTLQPVISDTDVFPMPDIGVRKSKHPGDYFCKTLTASDTSTHGGFSVPRRAAEKLFPQLDYSTQPPNQELAVRDLHDNPWTFRHIYRGQPKRHLLTSGWSVFVGNKRLKAGDSVLFIRDEKSQLLVGIMRANRQRTALPSVLSADSMHLGVFAAAAHAAANRSPFTVYCNPRACASEFVVSAAKFHRAAYNQISVGTRFGMMIETEDSGKRRFMGTVVAINDCDPLRWPNSKWRNLQVEWDEHSSVERPDRVSAWEIETPESLFVVPAFASTLKRQFHPEITGGESAQGTTAVIKRHESLPSGNGNGVFAYPPVPVLQSDQPKGSLIESQYFSSEIQKLLYLNRIYEQETLDGPIDRDISTGEKSHALVSELDAADWSIKEEPPLLGDLDVNNFNLSQLTSDYLDSSWWLLGSSGQHSVASSADVVNVLDPDMMQSLNHSQGNPDTKLLQSIYNTCGLTIIQERGISLGNHSHSNSCQDVQSQITTASLADCSGGTSSSNLDMEDRYHLNAGAWKQVSPPLRTYTKVHKAGSVGRSIDVTRFRNYEELKHAIACMFGLECQLVDPSGTGWKLVYVDYENDVLLVGDDPWEEFVTCVKCIRILSPSEMQQMRKQGLQLGNMVSCSGEAS